MLRLMGVEGLMDFRVLFSTIMPDELLTDEVYVRFKAFIRDVKPSVVLG